MSWELNPVAAPDNRQIRQILWLTVMSPRLVQYHRPHATCVIFKILFHKPNLSRLATDLADIWHADQQLV